MCLPLIKWFPYIASFNPQNPLPGSNIPRENHTTPAGWSHFKFMTTHLKQVFNTAWQSNPISLVSSLFQSPEGRWHMRLLQVLTPLLLSPVPFRPMTASQTHGATTPSASAPIVITEYVFLSIQSQLPMCPGVSSPLRYSRTSPCNVPVSHLQFPLCVQSHWHINIF